MDRGSRRVVPPYGIRPENLKAVRSEAGRTRALLQSHNGSAYRFFPSVKTKKKQFDEVEGIANRTDYDLISHTKGGRTVSKTVRFFRTSKPC
jgi:glycyl-tRNA synthetase (class II)